MSDEYDATAAFEAVYNFDEFKSRILELETKLNASISQADSVSDELMKLRYISGKAIKLFNSMAFVVLYHHQSIRDEFKYHGVFSNNLRIVYVEDDPMFINKIFGLHIIGYWFEHDTNLQCQEIIKQRMQLVTSEFIVSGRENG